MKENIIYLNQVSPLRPMRFCLDYIEVLSVCKDFSAKMENFIVILATMAAFWHRGSTQSVERKGKYLGYGGDDLWGDIFDELNDPIPNPDNSISVRDHVLKKLQKNKIVNPDPMPPLPIPLQLAHQVTARPPTTTRTTEETIIKIRRRNVTRPEPILVYDTSTHKLEVTPPGFASHVRPITEGMFMIGGKFEEQTQAPNMTDEKLKLFWSSVGDFIETVPFLPIQVNVPDLLAAMATFFSQRIPIINRITNPNEPRPKVPSTIPTPTPLPLQYQNFPVETNILEYRNMSPSTTKPKKNKKRKQNKKKGSNRRQTTESYKLKGSYFSTQVPKSQPTSRTWFAKSTEMPVAKATTEDLKLFHHNNSPGAEQLKYNNLAITRKKNRWADRELFNFKNSDISNSPIMILNMPSRPVLLYKFNHELKTQ